MKVRAAEEQLPMTEGILACAGMTSAISGQPHCHAGLDPASICGLVGLWPMTNYFSKTAGQFLSAFLI